MAPAAEQWEGGPLKVPWLVVAALALLVLVQPALVVFSSKFNIAPAFSTAAELASVMGSIFTAGGLIVALVSFYSLANVDKAVSEGVASAVAAIPRQLDERIRTFLDAYTSFREAQNLWSRGGFSALPTIEQLVLRAEAIEPTLRSFRPWSGAIFFEAARASYLREHVVNQEYSACPSPLDRPALAMKALDRLTPEFTVAEGANRTEIGVRLAILQALLGERARVICESLFLARESGPTPLLEGIDALALIAGCRTVEDVRAVLRAYGADEMSPTEIIDMLKASPEKNLQSFVAFVKSPAAIQYPPVSPTVVTFRTVDQWNSAFVEWFERVQPQFGTRRGGIPDYPEYDVASGTQKSPPFMALGDLVREATGKLSFVSAYNYEPLQSQRLTVAYWFESISWSEQRT
jgi:hypothetical protein